MCLSEVSILLERNGIAIYLIEVLYWQAHENFCMKNLLFNTCARMIQTAAVSCLGAALSATPASNGMISILSAKDPKGRLT